MSELTVEIIDPTADETKQALKLARLRDVSFLGGLPDPGFETRYPKGLTPQLRLFGGREGPAYCETFERAEVVAGDAVTEIPGDAIAGFRIYPYEMTKHPFTSDGEFLLLGLSHLVDSLIVSFVRLFRRVGSAWEKVEDFESGTVLPRGDRILILKNPTEFAVLDPRTGKRTDVHVSEGFGVFATASSLHKNGWALIANETKHPERIEIHLVNLDTLSATRLIEGPQSLANPIDPAHVASAYVFTSAQAPFRLSLRPRD